jgi:excisionase family DNA binding protein
VKQNERSYLSLREVADEIHVPVKSVYRLVQKGELPVTRIVTPLGKRAIRVKRSHLEVLSEKSRPYEGSTSDLSINALDEGITNGREQDGYDGTSKVSAKTAEPEAEPSTLQRFARFARLLRRRNHRAS